MAIYWNNKSLNVKVESKRKKIYGQVLQGDIVMICWRSNDTRMNIDL